VSFAEPSLTLEANMDRSPDLRTVCTTQSSALRISSQRKALKPQLDLNKFCTTKQFFTPRHRECLPENMLLCQTELTTSQQVLAHLDFKLPDSIPNASAISANQRGEVGTAKTKIRALQPCFAELHPPLVLNLDDRTSPPVVFRNRQFILAIDE
jgi:hypothetical protein